MSGISSQCFGGNDPGSAGFSQSSVGDATGTVTDAIADSLGTQIIANDAADALLGATTCVMNLYVDPVLGNDANVGDPTRPFRTIAAALAAVPRTIKHAVTIYLADGTYAEYINNPPLRLSGGMLRITGNMLREPTEIQRTADAVKCSLTTIGTVGLAWVVNSHNERWVRIVSGTGAGQTRKIKSNTADTLTSFYNYNPAPDGTSVYEIVNPGAVLTGTIPDSYYGCTVSLYNMGGSSFRPVALQNVSLSGVLEVGGDINFKCDGILVTKGVLLNGARDVSLGYVVYLNPGAVTSRNGLILKAVGVGSGLAYNSLNSSAQMSWAVVKGRIVADLLSRAGLADGLSLEGYLWATANSYVTIDTWTMSMATAVDNGIVAKKGGVIWASSCILQTGSSAVVPEDGGLISLNTVSGNGSARYGVEIIGNGLARISGVTVTGGLGDFKCGNRPVGTWAGITAYGPDDDGADQKLVRAVPANPGPWTIALGVALNGMLASGLVRVHDITAGAVLAEVAPAPGAGQFSVDYATGVVTFNTLQQTDTVAIYYRPVSYTGARIG